MNSIKNMYFTVFWLFFRFCDKAWSREINTAKGVAGVTLLQSWLLVGVIAWCYYSTGYKFLIAIPKVGFFLSFILLFAINYYVLIGQGRAAAFTEEFRNFGIRRRVSLIVAGIGLLALSVAFALLSAAYTSSP